MEKMAFSILTGILFSLSSPVYPGTLGDINSDGEIDLSEAIYALQVVAGIRSESVGPGETYTNSLGMAFVSIPAGTFTMGSPTDELGRLSIDELGGLEVQHSETQHQVTLTKSFYMQTTETTQGQWQSVMGSNPSGFSDCGDDCPVEYVSWDDIQLFITEMNKRGEGTYRLPTEAEWEYAARAGSSTALANGDLTVIDCSPDPNLDEMGWYCSNGCVNYQGGQDCSSWSSCSSCGTNPVAQRRPNAWGLYDMHGNVWEWCQDWYGSYPAGAVTDPTGPDSGMTRVVRGGGWNSEAGGCRSAVRTVAGPVPRSILTGFRLALSRGQ